jgi:hypothetical protein
MKAYGWVLSFVVAAIMGIVPQTYATNDIPYSISFEGIEEGTSLIDTNLSYGWYGEDGSVAAITNLSYAAKRQPPKVTYPMNDESHTSVLYFSSGAISNMFSQAELTNVYVDMMIQPVRMEAPATTEAVSNSQLTVYVDTNGFMTVWHGVNTSGYYQVDFKDWTVFDNLAPIGTDKWVRLTITMDYLSDLNTMRYFKMQVNGQDLSSSRGFQAPDSSFVSPGPWFLCANQNNAFISELSLSGSGWADDIVVTNGPVDIAYLPVTLSATVHGQGSITPSGDVELPYDGTTNFLVQVANDYFYISKLYTNSVSGVSNAVAGAQDTNVFDFTWANVTADGAVDAYVEPYRTAGHQTPLWWLASYGYTNDFETAETTDDDGDTLDAWEEYLAGTDPTNSTSALKIKSITYNAGNVVVEWYSTTNAVANYNLLYSTNLLAPSGGWQTLLNNIPRTEGTQQQPVAPANTRSLYRVTVPY